MIHNFREMQGCRPFILFDSPFRDTTKIDRLFSIKSFHRAMVSIAHRIEIHWTWRARRIRMHSGTKPYDTGGKRKFFSWNLKIFNIIIYLYNRNVYDLIILDKIFNQIVTCAITKLCKIFSFYDFKLGKMYERNWIDKVKRNFVEFIKFGKKINLW